MLAQGGVFVGALLESLALIGTIIPGSTIVFAAGVLAGLRVIDPWVGGLLAVAGAMLGDVASFLIGRRYRGVIRDVWPMRRYPWLVARGEAYFAANGRRSVFVGRFLGPVRAVVPLVAGMSMMPVGQFVGIDALAVLAWAAAHLFPGVLFGASLQLAGAVSSRLLVLVAILAAGLWLIALLMRLVTRRGWPYLKRLGEGFYLRASSGTGPAAKIVERLLDPARSEPLALLISATLLVAGAWLFLGVVEDVVTRDTLIDVDRAVYGTVSSLHSRAADDLMVTISELASAPVMLALVAAIAAYLAFTRRLRTLAHWLAAAVFAEIVVFALRHALARARPASLHAAADAIALPGGHAAMSLVVFGFLAFLLGHGKPLATQGKLALAAAAIAALVAFSRIYLGAHWLSDVIASFGLGIAWIALLGIAYLQHVRERPVHATAVLAIVAAVLLGVGVPYAVQHHDRDLARYAKVDVRPSLAFAAWRDGGWRTLPSARLEIRGEHEEPFSIQWVATRERLVEALGRGGWQRPARWKSSSALLWLVPSTPVDQLPVLPKLHEGEPSSLTLIRPRDAHTRDVIRLWHVADASDAPSGTTEPIHAGMITTERAQGEAGLLLTTRAAPREPAPGTVLDAATAENPHALAQRVDGAEVLLVW